MLDRVRKSVFGAVSVLLYRVAPVPSPGRTMVLKCRCGGCAGTAEVGRIEGGRSFQSVSAGYRCCEALVVVIACLQRGGSNVKRRVVRLWCNGIRPIVQPAWIARTKTLCL